MLFAGRVLHVTGIVDVNVEVQVERCSPVDHSVVKSQSFEPDLGVSWKPLKGSEY